MLTVVGSLNIDTTIIAPRFAAPGETLTARGVATALGGKGANQAVAAARAGATVRFVGAVGDDAAGAFGLRALADEGIDVASVRRVAETVTGAAFVMVDDEGENAIYVVPGANHALTPHDVQPAWLEGAEVVVLQGELRIDTTAAVVAAARASGARTILNLAPHAPLPPEVLAGVDVLVVNESEAAATLGWTTARVAESAEAASLELARLVTTVVITLGADGVQWRSGARGGRVTPHATDVVDTTGAGDAFTGNLAAAYARGANDEEAVAWGNAAGALAVTVRGATAGMPTKERTAAFLRR